MASKAKAGEGAPASSKRPTGTVEIFAPNAEYSGERNGVGFANGKAKADWQKDAAAIAYFRRQGYGIGERPKVEPRNPTPAVSALEAAAVKSVGGRLRDAAVDPHPDDFLPPVNAGKADPHGPLVVAPEIHHDGPAGLRPGIVHVDDVKQQEREESALAEAVLIDGQDKGEALGTFAPGDDQGDLGLSDPGSAEAGREGAAEAAAERRAGGRPLATNERPVVAEGPPAKRATVGTWREYAIAQGMDPDEATVATKDELIERFGGED